MAETDSVGAALRALTFEHTVAKALVHRRALSEVFLTDSTAVDDSHFVAGAQLPPSHAYYTDHTTWSAVDPLFLLECCRQAETHAVHAHFGAPDGTKFVLQQWSMELPGLAALEPAHGPAEVTIAVTTHDAQWVGGSLRGLRYRMAITVSGRPVGEVTMRVKYVADSVYGMLRGRRDGGGTPTSESYQRPATEGLVQPGRVGRERPENVVLLDPVTDGRQVRARLLVAGGHPSLFDHAQDHVPGMVLMEAGRQTALLTAEELYGAPAAAWSVTGIEASFDAYAELDEPLTVVGDGDGDGHGHGPGDAGAGALSIPVTFEQGGRRVARAAFTLERGGAGR
ncbi:ScbA/BarX family gamma-butyrolactone biosynthesis protein [Streptomyces violaceus]|uniref:Gamma-butyrolactone biosynthesis protein n=1 Tax=Streptomyces violaceus TaxID=1936 RepID=A0ABZ1P648_STRVL